METLDQLFDRLGKASGVAKIIGKSTEHSAAMKRRGSIPVRYWPDLITGAREKGLPLDEATLVAIHTKNREAA